MVIRLVLIGCLLLMLPAMLSGAQQETRSYYDRPLISNLPDNSRFLIWAPDETVKDMNITGAVLKLFFLDRANHSGVQAISTITGLQAALDSKAAASSLAAVAISGSYTDLSNPPTIPDNATQIAYGNPTYPTVAAALDQLLYVPISITSFTLSGGGNVTQELGSSYTITGGGLAWSTNTTATSQTINGTPRTSPWMPPSPVSTNQSYALQVGDGQTTASSTRTVTFTHKRYWGVSSSAAIDDAGIIALSSEFSTSRSQTRTMTAAAQYLYIVYVDTAGAASFTVNGFADTSWQLTQRSFTNASGYTTTFRIYRSANPLTGTYTVVVS